jgi:opacity protein-like surface antigen
MSGKLCGLMIGALCISTSSFAGPPLETDDPGTPGHGNWEINFASTLENRASTWEFKPLVDVNYGWGERVQLKLKPRLVVLDAEEEGARAGAGNFQVGVKWRFLDEDTHGVAMSIYPQADFNPPGRSIERGLVDEGHQLFLPFQVARTFGKTFVYFEAGYNWHEQQEDDFVFGLAAEYSVTDALKLVGELRNGATRNFDEHELFFNAGFKWKLHESWTLLASGGRTLREADGDDVGVFSYLGLQWTF